MFSFVSPDFFSWSQKRSPAADCEDLKEAPRGFGRYFDGDAIVRDGAWSTADDAAGSLLGLHFESKNTGEISIVFEDLSRNAFFEPKWSPRRYSVIKYHIHMTCPYGHKQKRLSESIVLF